MKTKALLLNVETKTIDGCQKIINIWQFRQRKIWFVIQSMIDDNKEYFNEFKELFFGENNIIDDDIDLIESSMEPIKRRYFLQVGNLMRIWTIITDNIENIANIQRKLIFEHYELTGDLYFPEYIYGGFVGKKSIDECENKILIY